MIMHGILILQYHPTHYLMLHFNKIDKNIHEKYMVMNCMDCSRFDLNVMSQGELAYHKRYTINMINTYPIKM